LRNLEPWNFSPEAEKKPSSILENLKKKIFKTPAASNMKPQVVDEMFDVEDIEVIASKSNKNNFLYF
jgi:hypothetical protein